MNKIVVVIGAICLLIIIVKMLSWLFNNQMTLSSYSSAKTSTVVASTSMPQGKDYNYTYGIWIYVDDWSYNFGREKVIFSKGASGSPKVSLGSVENNLRVSLPLTEDGDTSASMFECGVTNVPLQRWTHILVSVYGRSLDIYINGKLVRTCVMHGVPVYDVASPMYLTPDGGFSGFTSKFNYWSDMITPQQAWNIYSKGPTGNMFGNIFSDYALQLNFMKGNSTKATLTI